MSLSFTRSNHTGHQTDCSAQSFRINESKSDSTVLYLETQQSADLESASTKRKGSFKSIFSSPTLSPKSSRKSIQADATSSKSEVSQYFDNLSCLVIKFTEARGESKSARTRFLIAMTNLQTSRQKSLLEPS